MVLNKEESKQIQIKYNLDSLIDLDYIEIGSPKSFKDYVMLSFKHSKGFGRHGIIWKPEDSSFEMIIDNHVGQLVGNTKYYKLSANLDEEKCSELLRR